MNHFIITVLTFLIIGICVVIIFVNYRKKNYNEKNCLVEGMCLGMCFGVALATALKLNSGLGVGLGMLVGETIGMFIKKK